MCQNIIFPCVKIVLCGAPCAVRLGGNQNSTLHQNTMFVRAHFAWLFAHVCTSESLQFSNCAGLDNHNQNRPNWLRFVLPISSHVIIPLGSFSIILLFAFMAQLCMVRNMSENSKEVLPRDSSHDLKWV